MKNFRVVALCLVVFFAIGAMESAFAATRILQVGPGRTYTKPSQAAAASLDGDIIEIDAGTYSGDACTWYRSNLVIRGVGTGRAHMAAAGVNAGGKGTWVIAGANTTVENIEFSGATVPDNNGAGIRQEGAGLRVRNCYFHDNQNGILAGANAASDIVIEYSEFSNNGFGDGQTHNMYIGNVRTFTLQHCYTHHAKVGHLIKSRAQTNYILYNRITGESGNDSYEINLPNGGRSYVIGNLIQQGPNTGNSVILTYAEEGATNTIQELYVVNNTFVNERTSGSTFVRVVGSPAQSLLMNNIFSGVGTILSGVGTQTTNLVSSSPGFVNTAGFDYRLTSTSPAINAGTAPGSGGGFSLAPVYQYVHNSKREVRPVVGATDIGAYEFGSSTPTNQAPTVATAAKATPSPVTGKTATLSVLGADDAGEAGLTYTWATTGTPPAPVTFSANGTNAAKSTTATFSKAGAYSFQVTIKDAGNLTATSSVSVTVNATLTTLSVSPASVTLNIGASQTFTASGKDQFGNAMPSAPAVSWSTTGGGSITTSGVYTASGPAGSYSVKATSGTLSGTAAVTIPPPNQAPTVATAAKATPSPVIARTTTLSVLGADDAGEATLTYTWATTGTPPAAVTFSANGTNAAKNTTATFSKAGAYSFQVTIKDAGNLIATSSVSVSVNATLTSLSVSPTSVTLNIGASQTFTASGKDQFGNAMPSAPVVSWSTTGGGSITTAGVYTAGGPAGSYSVKATSGTLSATAAVTIPVVNRSPVFASPASATPNPALVGDLVSFSSSASDPDGDTLTSTWNFGDGTSATGANASHAYGAAGTYTAVVSVTDGKSPAISQSITVTVNAVPSTMVKINFQPAGASVPAGYLADAGAVFASRGNGYSYGWNADNSAQARDRNAANSPDQRYDTFTHMQKPAVPNAVWEIALPNGSYSVRIVAGDASYYDSTYRINAENVLTVSGTPSATVKWFEGSQTVNVSDGRLTISNGAGAANNKIAFVEITTGTASAPTLAKFQTTPESNSLEVTKLRVRLDRKTSTKDIIHLSGTLNLPKDFKAEGSSVNVDVGGAAELMVLNARNNGVSKGGVIALRQDRRTGKWLFTASLKGALWKERLEDSGLLSTTGKQTETVVPVTLTVNGTVYGGGTTVLFDGTRGQSGEAK
ncbi:MAG TPA: PKD domain-containing protein [Planctomycetota bacterium]|nr:PKD domain-containing protein [Planctomycetota bacterium]